MIMPNAQAHMSPKDRMRQMALEAQTVPGWGLNDKAFHASFDNNYDYLVLIGKIHVEVRMFYLDHGHILDQWQVVNSSSHKFNRVWRDSLRLPLDDAPPPISWRLVLPSSLPF
jgi:hypothetical protein